MVIYDSFSSDRNQSSVKHHNANSFFNDWLFCPYWSGNKTFKGLTHKTSIQNHPLIPPNLSFYYNACPCERSACICVLGVTIFPPFKIFLLEFLTVTIAWFLLFYLYFYLYTINITHMTSKLIHTLIEESFEVWRVAVTSVENNYR